MYVDVYEGGHEELAVEPVHDAAVAGDDVAKVLDLEGPLEAGGEEAAEGADHAREDRHEESVDEERVDGQRGLQAELRSKQECT